MTTMQIKERISALVEETAGQLGYLIYESSFLYKGDNSQIHVKLDSLAGITLQDCERFSRELSAGIDDDDELPNCSIEVSSPGLNREVRDRDEFIRFTGAPVKVVYDEGAARKVAKGVIENTDGPGVTVKTESGDIVVPYETIVSANLDY